MENTSNFLKVPTSGSTCLKLSKKRKLYTLKGTCNSAIDCADNKEEILMPNLDNEDSCSISSYSQKRGIELKLTTKSKRSQSIFTANSKKISEEISSMKESANGKRKFGEVKPLTQNYTYLFATHAKPKSKKEKNIAKYLNVVGIFQIHLSEALKELH